MHFPCLFNVFKTAEYICYFNEQDRPGAAGHFLLLQKVLASEWFAGNGFKKGKILSCWVHFKHLIKSSHWHGSISSAHLIWTGSCVKCLAAACQCVNCGAGMQQSLDGNGTLLVKKKLMQTSGVWTGVDPILSLNLIYPCVSLFVWVLRVYTHQLCHSVDIDFSLLHASTEEHGCCHQEVVCYTVSINVQGCDLTAIVGANLKKTYSACMKFWDQ